jgi:hypothetical protein
MRKQIEDLDLQIHPRRPDEAIEAGSNERNQIDKEETGSLIGAKRGIIRVRGEQQLWKSQDTLISLTESVKTGSGTRRMLLGSLDRNPKYHEPTSECFLVFIDSRLSYVQRK